MKSRKTGSRICCVMLHKALSRCIVATIHVQLYLLKEVSALQSFQPPITCCVRPQPSVIYVKPKTLYSKVQTACLSGYQPPSYKLQISVILMMRYVVVGTLQHY